MGTVHAKSATERNDNINPVHEKMPPHSHKPLHRDNHDKTKKQNTGSTKEAIHLDSIKARVDKIHVDGLSRTKDDIVKTQVTELFKAKNFEDIITNTLKVHSRLEALGCFKSIWVYIDASRGLGATPEGVEVTFNVRELSRLTGEVNTMVGNNEGSLLIGVKTPNLLGRGEKLSLEYSRGSKSTTNFNISATKPFMSQTTDSVLTGNIFSTSLDFPWSGYKQSDNGFLIDLTTNPSGTLTHTWQYEAVIRKITAARTAAFAVREECGPNMKSAFRHVCTLDKRDSNLFPTSGSLLKFSTEIAGFGGDIGFVKNEFIVQSNWTPHESFTFQLGLQAGLLRSINNNKKINIADKFFLGGPLSLRGFDMRGCGPRVDGNSIGGDVYWAGALHFYTPLPFISSKNTFSQLFKLHGFLNGGNLTNFSFDLSKGVRDNCKIFTNDVRCSIGAGLTLKLGSVARVELNFIHPLRSVKSDVLRQFQFGIGVQYL